MTLLKIALRNVLKNRRRSLITVLAIAFGFMAVAMFQGYTHQAYEKMRLAVVFLEAPGHVVVYKKGFLDRGRLYPEDYLFTREEAEALSARIRSIPGVRWVGKKLELTGLVSNGDVSTIFLADAMDPAAEKELWDRHYTYRRIPARPFLPPDRPDAIFVGPGLAELLDLGRGDGVVLMATTQYGQMNAVDATVWGTRETFSDQLSDKYARLPLGLAQSLYDTGGCDRLCVLYRSHEGLGPLRAEIERRAAAAGVPVETRTWVEVSQYYRKAKNFLDVVFVFLFSITCLIVVLGVVNTMSMAVYERFREIGTLRAIGFKPRGVMGLFAAEGLVLGVIGASAGLLLTVVGRALVAAGDIRYRPPGVAELIRVEIDLVPGTLGLAFALFAFLAVVSAAFPARRAARAPIVETLGHV